MKIRKIGQSFMMATMVLASLQSRRAARAAANESSFGTSVTIYAAPTGLGNQSGSDAANAKELQAAINSVGSASTKVLMTNGLYRNYYSVGAGTNTLVIEAQNAGQAIITGSNRVTNWTSEGSGVYSFAWTGNWPLGTVFPDAASSCTAVQRRKELVFIDGARLKPVANNDSTGSAVAASSLNAGEFTVNDGASKIYFKPPTGVNLSASNDVQTAVRGTNELDFNDNNSRCLMRVDSHSNFCLRGVIFEHSSGYFKTDPSLRVGFASIQDSTPISDYPTNILIDNCTFRQNNGIGFDVVGIKDFTIKNCVAADNGERGMGGYNMQNGLIQDSQFVRNNWRGGHYMIFNDAAGIKVFDVGNNVSNNNTFLRCNISNNQTNGYWQDYAGYNTVMDHCLIENNVQTSASLGAVNGYGDGFVNEKSPGFTIKNSVIRNNGTSGITTSPVANIVLDNNYIYDNGNYGQAPGARSYGTEINIYTDYRVRPTFVSNSLTGLTVTNNTIATFGASGDSGRFWNTGGENNGQYNSSSGRTMAQEIAYRLTSNHNNWAKRLSDNFGPYMGFSLNTTTQTPNLTLAQWQAQSNSIGQQDLVSQFVDRSAFSLSNVPDPTTGVNFYAGYNPSSTPTPTPSGLVNRATGGTAAASSTPVAGEGAAQAFDGGSNTKWLGNWNNPSWLQYTFPNNKAYTITQYAIASANDVPSRDPKDWTLQGSNNGGTSWTSLSSSQSNQSFGQRNTFNPNYSVTNTTAYKSYRLLITANNGDSLVQLSELQLLGDSSETGNGGSSFVVPIGSTVGLKSASTNQYVSTNLNNGANLQANYAGSVGSWEKYRIDDAGGGKIGLFSLNNSKYVSVNQNSGGAVQAGFANSIGSWEQFTWTDAGSGQIALLSGISGKYVTVGSNGLLNGNTSSFIGTAERFTSFTQ